MDCIKGFLLWLVFLPRTIVTMGSSFMVSPPPPPQCVSFLSYKLPQSRCMKRSFYIPDSRRLKSGVSRLYPLEDSGRCCLFPHWKVVAGDFAFLGVQTITLCFHLDIAFYLCLVRTHTLVPFYSRRSCLTLLTFCSQI